MKSLFLTSNTLTQHLQTLDNLMALKMLQDKGHEIPGDLAFEADCWGDTVLELVLGILFSCKPVEREVTRTTSNGSYSDRETVLSLEGYDDWIRLKGVYPEMEEAEEEMRDLEFSCDYMGSGLSISFDADGLVLENSYGESFYVHTILEDFFTLKHMWTETLSYWRKKKIEDLIQENA
ncbi:hypothetical protein SAMN04487897_109117 [Paenibacillus sp. yr247]|uniref:hypothetical protein n=1 Tax=Paenibacillus sp. yr247 TaxID=1761880 RepID=UPI0008856711|nr:hypothetical protein [Paenibacillus sp. yr247]SDO17869.1 hypothetical protein SAMN04487897_109117 [Paenibacillus sp. yr247]